MRGEHEPAQLVIHNDDDTPDEFVIGLLRQVFGKTEREAIALITQIEQKEKAVCGPYRNPSRKRFSSRPSNMSGSASIL
ncbi:ATP-dependent Clp protease adaptor ClpS [Bradyrhizobium japonicum]